MGSNSQRHRDRPAEDSELNRWQRAQEAERAHPTAHHEMRGDDQAIEQLSHLNIAPDELTNATVLAVGAGAGVIHSLPESTTAIAVDPITHELADRGVLTESNAQLTTGAGEALPFPNDCFDYVICWNVLDHVVSPQQVLAEMRRVLLPGGILGLSVNTFRNIAPLRSLLDRFDSPHPHHYARSELLNLIRESGFIPEVVTERPKTELSLSNIKLTIAILVFDITELIIRCEPNKLE